MWSMTWQSSSTCPRQLALGRSEHAVGAAAAAGVRQALLRVHVEHRAEV